MSTTILLASQQSAQGGNFTFIFMIIAMFVIMWFFMIRPQQKRQKEIRKFQNSLQEGVNVVTGGGIYGTVKKVDFRSKRMGAKHCLLVEDCRGEKIYSK